MIIGKANHHEIHEQLTLQNINLFTYNLDQKALIIFNEKNVSITNQKFRRIGHFTVVYLVAKPLIWSEAEGDLVVIETSIQLA